ncbi:hypothetical protein B14911_19620 [Bacillus sp. NRRL B-14911]|nr:hypothetical protein B14911_19620 [Bacillus sp. NRRL B-14911]
MFIPPYYIKTYLIEYIPLCEKGLNLSLPEIYGKEPLRTGTLTGVSIAILQGNAMI